jgi:hypothetical protein
MTRRPDKQTLDRALEAALPAARQLTVQAGRLTGRWRMTPTILICGAQRCGTTSMYQALRQHPAVLRPVLHKGVHYFDVDYARGLNWYRAHFPLLVTAKRRAGRVGGPVQTFESSPYYLFHPLATQRIAVDLPDAKVLVLVRDPVERAYSAYTHEHARGYETESFERALELEDERLAGAEAQLIADPHSRNFAHQHHGYVHRGRYIDQIERAVAALGAERIRVLDAEDFWSDPLPVWQEVADFLQLPAAPDPDVKQHNARPRSSMDPALRHRLAERFADSDERLARWWGRDPSWRR